MNPEPPAGFLPLEPGHARSRDRMDRLQSAAVEKYTDRSAAAAPQILGLALLVAACFAAHGGIAAALVFFGLLCIVHGAARCRKWRCSACKNPVASREVTRCAACGLALD